MSSSFGAALRLTVFGQSHGAVIGMTLDGFPVGFAPDFSELQNFLSRRSPKTRAETDKPEFLSGLFEGKTCGAPLTAIIRNKDANSADYEQFRAIPRPSHADFPAHEKFRGAEDFTGGGHFSGRLTAPLCVAGGLCLQYLETLGVVVEGKILQIGTATGPDQMEAELTAAKADGDSVGGIIECTVTGLPIGLGEPMFDSLESRLSHILFSIPAIKGVEFGSGFGCAALRGSQHNDAYYMDGQGAFHTKTNRAGGILGGLSTGMPLVFRVAVKPTPSIAKPQETADYMGNPQILTISGRHDCCIVPRAMPCVEAAAAVALLDAILEAKKWN